MRLSALIAAALLASATNAAPAYKIIDRIAGPDGGWDYIRVNPAAARAYVTHGGSVLAIDLQTRAVTPGLAPGARLHDAMPVNGGRELLVTNGGSNSAVFADAQTGATIATVATGKGPDAAVFDAHSGLVAVMNHGGGDITLIDPKTRAAVGTIAVGGALEAAEVDGTGRLFVNIEDANAIAVIDIARRKVVARHALPGCDGPTGLAFDPRDKLLIAACDGATVILRADDGKVLATLATGKGADGAVFDTKQRLAFIPAGHDGTLSVIAVDGAKSRIVQTLPTQISARTIALDPATGRIYLPAANYGTAPAGGGWPPQVPGSFNVLVVDK